MFRTVARLAGYVRAPRATFTLKHPIKSVKLLQARRNLRRTFSPGRLAAGVGAAAMALPLGMWIRRRMKRQV